MTQNCRHQDCRHPASMAPTINIPATGFPIALHQPIRMVVGLPLCRQHARETTPEQLLTADLKRAIEITCRMSRKASPDFARAFVMPISIEGEEYQNFVALRAGRAS